MNKVVCPVCAGWYSACLCVYLRGCREVRTLTDTQVWLLLMSSAAKSDQRDSAWHLQGRKGGRKEQVQTWWDVVNTNMDCGQHVIFTKVMCYCVFMHVMDGNKTLMNNNHSWMCNISYHIFTISGDISVSLQFFSPVHRPEMYKRRIRTGVHEHL